MAPSEARPVRVESVPAPLLSVWDCPPASCCTASSGISLSASKLASVFSRKLALLLRQSFAASEIRSRRALRSAVPFLRRPAVIQAMGLDMKDLNLCK